ncbi:hypothetical protein TIFTF001_003060 [Ficus carica]|uniref:Uncharacterized protein n=1 Tax=Ficus carica TaxID=3494 RepID=A0AA87ZDK4_FICCA|nr:hypothetical protein TIFTF001_003060 [Ficus carica]
MGGRSPGGGDFAIPEQWKLAEGGAVIDVSRDGGPRFDEVCQEGVDWVVVGGCLGRVGARRPTRRGLVAAGGPSPGSRVRLGVGVGSPSTDAGGGPDWVDAVVEGRRGKFGSGVGL